MCGGTAGQLFSSDPWYEGAMTQHNEPSGVDYDWEIPALWGAISPWLHDRNTTGVQASQPRGKDWQFSSSYCGGQTLLRIQDWAIIEAGEQRLKVASEGSYSGLWGSPDWGADAEDSLWGILQWTLRIAWLGTCTFYRVEGAYWVLGLRDTIVCVCV